MVPASVPRWARPAAASPVRGWVRRVVALRSDPRWGEKALSSVRYSEPRYLGSPGRRQAGLLVGYSTTEARLTAASGGGQPVSASNPIWAKTLLIVGVCAGLIAAVGSVTAKDPELERRIYWLGALVAALWFAVAGLARGWA